MEDIPHRQSLPAEPSYRRCLHKNQRGSVNDRLSKSEVSQLDSPKRREAYQPRLDFDADPRMTFQSAAKASFSFIEAVIVMRSVNLADLCGLPAQGFV